MLASGSRSSLKHTSLRLPVKILENGLVSNIKRYQCRYSSTGQPTRDSFLKSQPWNFNRDASFQNAQLRGDLASYNVKLAEQASRGRFLAVLETAKSMKDAGVTPDVNTYTYITQALSRGGLSTEIQAIIEDMVRMGLKPTRAIMTHLVEAQDEQNYSHVSNTLLMMGKLGLTLGPETYAILIRRFVEKGSLEMALQYLHHMIQHDIVPELRTIQGVIALAAELGQPRLAIDLATNFEKNSVRRLDHETWMRCLVSSAEELYADGVCQCWATAVQDMKITPNEGLCEAVLNTAARHGLPDLATDALRVLKLIGVQWQEHHFAPLVEAFSKADRIGEALSTLDIMRKSDIIPTIRTALSVATAIGEDVDKLDATWTSIDETFKGGKTVDVCALNVILQVCVKLGDLQRAVGTYKAFGEYNVTPDLDTYNLILECCVLAEHRELGDKILADLREARVRPNIKTYEFMTLLCLTQDTYEDAFYYLEETKSSKFTPTYRAYDTLVRKCVAHNDPRYQLALDELQDVGYHPTDELLALLDHAKEARRAQQVNEEMEQLGGVGLDGAARRFIESGGLEGNSR